MSSVKRLRERIISKEAVIGVVGLGYVGLPLVLEFARAGHKVLGLDIDAEKTRKLNNGESYLLHFPAETIAEQVNAGRLEATTDFARSAEADAILICVPTPLGTHHEPDLSYIVSTAEALSPHLRPGQLIVLESTTYPGTTNGILRETLEQSGLKADQDFLLAFSPEREDPGNKDFSLGKIPKVVGGTSTLATELAAALYANVTVSVVPVADADTAEAVKLTENIFRAVNIALVNELKIIYDRMGIDVWDVIKGASTKPFGYMPFHPGPGLGGHCIPIDPFYLSWRAKEFSTNARFIELAGEINTAMPRYVVGRLAEALNASGICFRNAHILLVGMAYKPDVDDIRESPALELFKRIADHGAHVEYYDPYIPVLPKTRKYPELQGNSSITWNLEMLATYDAVLICTHHACIDYHALVSAAKLVVDTRNATANVTEGREKIRKA